MALPLYDYDELVNEPRSRPQTNYDLTSTTTVLNGVARLRRFLAFCLAIDYRISVRPTEHINEDDFKIFLNIAMALFCENEKIVWRRSSTGSLRQSTVLVPKKHPILRGQYLVFAREHEDAELEQEVSDCTPFFAEVVKATGLSLATVISMLRLFISSLAQKTLEPRIRWLCRTHGIRTVWDKLNFDRDYMFAQVFPVDDRQPKIQLEFAQVEYQMRWFHQGIGLTKKGKEQLMQDRVNERYWIVRVSCTYNKKCEMWDEVHRALKKKNMFPQALWPVIRTE